MKTLYALFLSRSKSGGTLLLIFGEILGFYEFTVFKFLISTLSNISFWLGYGGKIFNAIS